MIQTQKGPIAEPGRRSSDILGLCLVFAGLAGLLWLIFPQNAPVAAGMEAVLRLVAGSGSYIIPVIIAFVGVMFLSGFDKLAFSHSTGGSLLLFITYTSWRHIVVPLPALGPGQDGSFLTTHVMSAGGYVGACFGWLFVHGLGLMGSYVLLSLFCCISLVLIVDRPFIEMMKQVHRPAAKVATTAAKAVGSGARGVIARRSDRKAKGTSDEPVETEPVRKIAGRAPKSEMAALDPATRRISGKKGKMEASGFDPSLPTQPSLPFAEKDSETPTLQAGPLFQSAGDEEFQLPPLSILREPVVYAPKRFAEENADKIKILEQTLEHFNIQANVVEIANGPTVTRFEIQLAPGIKVSRIVSLADNLALALAAIDVRVEAPIPGKSAIGIEVPSSKPAMVSLREVLDYPDFTNAASKLTFALGKDVAGQCKYADLTRMPHLLVAGSTNSGKSVCLNVIIASIVYRATPREVQFLMIDPKRVELSLWDGIPHLMHPVVKDVRQAPGIFRAAIKEMDRRYDLFARLGTRNIEGYNQKVEPEEKLPFLVLVVDELADLMMQAGAEIETSICRLAQLARATGIHLVIATQRPSVDVITGLIKANISSRIAFAVSSQVDSRTILDASGADRLIGRGDMLFLPIDASKPVRIQGCFLSEQETDELVKYLKTQESPNFTFKPVEVTGSNASYASDGDSEDDEFFESAVRLVVNNGQASTSMLQRRFKIGYTRAARLVDIMQERGIVGALDGAKPREILISRDEVERMFAPNFD